MSLKKTKEEVQLELDEKYGSGKLSVISYTGRDQPCKIIRYCGCSFTPIYRTLKDLNYSFCEHYQQDLILNNLKEKYPEYSFEILSFKTPKIRTKVRVIGVQNNKSFEVDRSYESLLTSFKLSKKELKILYNTVKPKSMLTVSSYHMGIKQKARECFISECTLLYPFNDYTKIVYNGNKGKVLNILCKKHNQFFNCNYEARSHKKGRGILCTICKEEHQIKNIESKRLEYIERFEEKHGDKYDYSSFIYKGSDINTTFTCSKHGSFEQTPKNHLKNTFGCQICGAEASNGFGKQAYIDVCNGRESELYLVKIYNEAEVFYKVGITVEGVKKRFKNRKRVIGYKFDVIKSLKKDAEYIWNLEQEIHKEFRNTIYKYIPLNKFQGHTECYSSPEPFYKYFQQQPDAPYFSKHIK